MAITRITYRDREGKTWPVPPELLSTRVSFDLDIIEEKTGVVSISRTGVAPAGVIELYQKGIGSFTNYVVALCEHRVVKG